MAGFPPKTNPSSHLWYCQMNTGDLKYFLHWPALLSKISSFLLLLAMRSEISNSKPNPVPKLSEISLKLPELFTIPFYPCDVLLYAQTSNDCPSPVLSRVFSKAISIFQLLFILCPLSSLLCFNLCPLFKDWCYHTYFLCVLHSAPSTAQLRWIRKHKRGDSRSIWFDSSNLSLRRINLDQINI